MKNKKIIGIILAFVLCFITTLVVATATSKSTTIEILTDKSELYAGETATVSVKVTTNYPVATMSIPVLYDKTLVSVSDATATLTDYAVKKATTDSESVNSSKIYANTDISEDAFGFVLVNYIGGAGESVPATIDSVVLTFTITAKTDVEGDAVIKCVTESAKTGNNVAGMLYFGSPTSGRTINAIPENVEKIDVTEAVQTVAIKQVKEPNTIAIKEDAPYNPIIDTVNKGEFTGSVYGFDTLGWNDNWEVDGTIADFVTTAYGDEYLEVIVPDIGVETTGTIINVLDENGETIETYVFVYFGDMDMDGEIGEGDAIMAADYGMLYEGIDNLASFMAGDLDGDAMPGESDATVMADWAMLYEGIPFQADVGAMASGNVYEIF